MKLVVRLLAMAGALLAMLGASATAAQSETTTSPAAVAGCVGDSFAATLSTGQAICNGNYLVRMQPNGDLVLREVSTGRACWWSGTRAPGDASANFSANIPYNAPWVTIDSASQGRLTKIWGWHGYTEFGRNANVNSKGEFWIGFKRIGWC